MAQQKQQEHPALIVGAGLAGALLAVGLGKRGLPVQLLERRADPRRSQQGGGRSINLALSARGLQALEGVGLAGAMLQLALPMRGRLIHPQQGEPSFFPYGSQAHEVIYSISRAGLNEALIDAAEATGKVSLHFEQPCTDIRFGERNAGGAPVVATRDGQGRTLHWPAQVVLGADGAGSAVRPHVLKARPSRFGQEFLSHGYKELHLAPDPQGAWRLRKDCLHIWPRGDYMLIALPNLDGSFTCTLFLDWAGSAQQPGFRELEDPQVLAPWFAQAFPDLAPLLPDLGEQWRDNPTSDLGTLRCWPWQARGQAALLGDAAHAIVPFYGQGMNASFEDVRVLLELYDQHGAWSELLPAYADARKPNGDAIADLALQNFVEMRDHTADPAFQRKRQLELELERRFPGEFHSKYNLVTFQPAIPYAQAKARGDRQDAQLMAWAQRQPEGEADWRELLAWAQQ